MIKSLFFRLKGLRAAQSHSRYCKGNGSFSSQFVVPEPHVPSFQKRAAYSARKTTTKPACSADHGDVTSWNKQLAALHIPGASPSPGEYSSHPRHCGYPAIALEKALKCFLTSWTGSGHPCRAGLSWLPFPSMSCCPSVSSRAHKTCTGCLFQPSTRTDSCAKQASTRHPDISGSGAAVEPWPGAGCRTSATIPETKRRSLCSCLRLAGILLEKLITSKFKWRTCSARQIPEAKAGGSLQEKPTGLSGKRSYAPSAERSLSPSRVPRQGRLKQLHVPPPDRNPFTPTALPLASCMTSKEPAPLGHPKAPLHRAEQQGALHGQTSETTG